MSDHYKFWIVTSLIAVFAAGILAGVLFERHILDRKPQRDSRGSSVRFPTLETMAIELDLTTQQQEEIRQIFRNNEDLLKDLKDQINTQFASLRTKLKEGINEVLTPEQRKKFQDMIEKYIKQRRGQREVHKRRSKRHNSKRPSGERQGERQ